MHRSIKLLFAALTCIVFCALLSPAPVNAQDDFLKSIIEKRNKPKQMQSITVAPTKSAEEEAAVTDTDKADSKEGTEQNNSDASPKTTETEQTAKKKKVWENYKKISTEDLTGKPESADKTEDNAKEEKVAAAKSSNKKNNKTEKEEQQPEEEGEVIKSVLDEYKKLNNEKSTIGKRSFGDIGW